MLWDLPIEVTAWISHTRIGVRAARPWLPRRPAVAAAVGPFSDLGRALDACCRNRRRSRLTVWIGSAACRFFSFDVDERVRNSDERLALASAIGDRRYGLSRQQWRISIDRRADKSSVLACGVEAELLREVRSVASAFGCKLVDIAPWLSAATRHPAVAAHAARQLLVHEPNAISAVCETVAGKAVHSLSCDDGEGRADVKSQLIESCGLGPDALSIQLTLDERRLASGSSYRLLDLVEIEK